MAVRGQDIASVIKRQIEEFGGQLQMVDVGVVVGNCKRGMAELEGELRRAPQRQVVRQAARQFDVGRPLVAVESGLLERRQVADLVASLGQLVFGVAVTDAGRQRRHQRRPGPAGAGGQGYEQGRGDRSHAGGPCDHRPSVCQNPLASDRGRAGRYPAAGMLL